MRITGVDLPEQKSIWIALTQLYGLGRKNSAQLLREAKVEMGKKTAELSRDEVSRITKVLEDWKIEGDLRREVTENIKRLKEIGSYRGIRHGKGLPVRGQRTRTNARTKRGKRITIGALKKETMSRTSSRQPGIQQVTEGK